MTPELPETVEAMMPLYAAIVHGCRAGRVQEACDEVYWRRILRGEEFFITKMIGAFSANLTASAGFQPTRWRNLRMDAWRFQDRLRCSKRWVENPKNS